MKKENLNIKREKERDEKAPQLNPLSVGCLPVTKTRKTTIEESKPK